jgi:hypothetical protein
MSKLSDFLECLDVDDNKLDIKNSHKCFEFLFNLGYICIPVSSSSDDFLFIHYKKRHILDKIINIL